jgi:hypothetical protein
MVASSATTHNYSSSPTTNNYGSYAMGQHSTAIGYYSTALGNANIAIGSGAVSRVSTDKDFKYGGDYSERSLIDKSIIDMGFLNDMQEALENAENRQEKALKNYQHKQAKLDNIAEKVRKLKNNFSGGNTNTLMTKIDEIKAEYDGIVSRQQSTQQQVMSRQSNMVNDFLGRKGIKLDSPPPPPPFPPARKVGVEGQPVYGQDRGYYQPTTPEANLTKFTDIEYVKFLIRNTEVEEKTFKDIKYLDFIFSHPIDQENGLLNILEKGDVIEWVKVPKNRKMGMLSSKIKLIKAIRISVKDLEEARKEQTNES